MRAYPLWLKTQLVLGVIIALVAILWAVVIPATAQRAATPADALRRLSVTEWFRLTDSLGSAMIEARDLLDKRGQDYRMDILPTGEIVILQAAYGIVGVVDPELGLTRVFDIEDLISDSLAFRAMRITAASATDSANVYKKILQQARNWARFNLYRASTR